jgi:hypothetical protein
MSDVEESHCSKVELPSSDGTSAIDALLNCLHVILFATSVLFLPWLFTTGGFAQ